MAFWILYFLGFVFTLYFMTLFFRDACLGLYSRRNKIRTIKRGELALVLFLSLIPGINCIAGVISVTICYIEGVLKFPFSDEISDFFGEDVKFLTKTIK